jgi:hypothetical protein
MDKISAKQKPSYFRNNSLDFGETRPQYERYAYLKETIIMSFPAGLQHLFRHQRVDLKQHLHRDYNHQVSLV